MGVEMDLITMKMELFEQSPFFEIGCTDAYFQDEDNFLFLGKC